MPPVAYTVAFLVPASLVAGLLLGGPWAWATLIFVFVLTPGLDAALGRDERNAGAAEEAARLANPWFDVVLRAWVPIHLGLLVWAAWAVSLGGRPLLDTVGLTVSTGVMTAAGINVAHELMHRKARRDRALAEVLMTLATYPHFCVEHVLGHHRNVATPEDAASARLGESVYGFVPRSIVGGVRSAWRLERHRATERGEAGTLRDRRVRYALDVALLHVGAFALGGGAALAFVAAQGLVAVVHLEIINYVEHYGLQRERLPSGRYERVQPRHSWNSAHRLTGLYLFGLPRHADHHFLASRPYAVLRHHPGAPQLPAGYATMLLLTLAPPLWRRAMDPRVRALGGEQVADRAPGAVMHEA